MKKTTILVCLLAVTVVAAYAAAEEVVLPPVPLQQYTLDNGLTVFLVEDHSVPIAVVNINYMVGSKNEKVGRTGFAHLFEHMMFQGSANWNEDYFKPLQEIGGRVNGGTNTDRTRYWEQVPAAYLERALWMEADRTVYLVDKPGAAQSQINIGRLGTRRSDPAFPSLEVMNMILGGQFMSRLNLNLREDKGYTYGCRSGFDYRLVPGLFTASSSVQTERSRRRR